jgi:hypothetical protein
MESPSAVVTKYTEEGIATGGLSQGLQRVIVDLLRPKLDRALMLAQTKSNQIDPEFGEQTRRRASTICRVVREQLAKIQLDTHNRECVEKKLKEIERLLEGRTDE